ncbi:MAG: hypothetical protein ACRDMJ_05105, partial [Solirubrobacteraceae bacterium]
MERHGADPLSAAGGGRSIRRLGASALLAAGLAIMCCSPAWAGSWQALTSNNAFNTGDSIPGP